MGFEFVKKSMSISLEHSLSCNDQGQKPPYLTTLDRSIPRMRTEVLRPLLQKCNVRFKCYSEDDSECSAFSPLSTFQFSIVTTNFPNHRKICQLRNGTKCTVKICSFAVNTEHLKDFKQHSSSLRRRTKTVMFIIEEIPHIVPCHFCGTIAG